MARANSIMDELKNELEELIARSFGCELDLGETIAKGYSKCEIRFRRS